MTTIREVAKLAGVAPITVSRVINNSGYISEETRQKVEMAVSQLGYVPNTLSQSLRWKQTGVLALVLTDVTNPFWTTVARGVEDAASQAGYNVILCNTDESPKKQDSYLTALLQKRVDGVLLVPARDELDVIQRIQTLKVPLVVLDRRPSQLLVDSARCDSAQGAYQLTRLLLERGHRQIALLTGSPHVATSIDRLDGYRRALREFDLAESAEMVLYGAFTLESGQEMTRLALAMNPRPTAIFAGNNFIAIGMMQSLHEAGIRVPEEMSVVGFDDLPASLLIDPFLTVAVQPAYEMGVQALKMLINRLTGDGTSAPQEVILPVEIVERRSVLARVNPEKVRYTS
jgi:LacI family transcriptional regulator